MALEQQTHTNIDHTAIMHSTTEVWKRNRESFLGNLNFKFYTVRTWVN